MESSRRFLVVPKPAVAGEVERLQSRTDDELMLLARGGHEAAFSTLIRRHQSKILRLAVRYLGREAMAADVAQDTFVEIFRALPRYQAHGKFSSYLYRVLLSRCHMTWRSARSERHALEFVEEDTVLPEAELLLRERQRDVALALGKLSEKLRCVVLLRYSAELSYEEIAETLQIPSGTVKRRLFDAMAKLRDGMEGP